MKWQLFPLLSFLLLVVRAKALDFLSLYERYLVEFDKDAYRLRDTLRVQRFAASLRAVYDCSTSSSNYNCKVNDYSDWLQDELDAIFNTEAIAEVNEEGISGATLPPPLNARATKLSYSGSNSSYMKMMSSGLFTDSIDWTSSNNPLGASVITSIRNQGQCGACWAFVSAAAIEASVRINTGHSVPLSVQELIDCDKKKNKGCSGGNPVYAYDYAMTSGLERWSAYPYTENPSSSCRRVNSDTKSYIKNYVRIPTKNQQILKDFVRISPVSVGVCGTDDSFLYYSSGVYDTADCCTTQNHALLVVGYGHDNSSNLDFWLAMNSWGPRWGDKGYIRLKRTSDLTDGQCGIAQSPSMAIGGFLISADDSADINVVNVWYNSIASFVRENWIYFTLIASLLLSIYSIVLILYVLFMDYREYRRRRERAKKLVTVPLPLMPSNIYGSVNNSDDV